MVFFACAALVVVCLRRWDFLDLVVCATLSCLCFYGVGLSLFSSWSISVRPCAGQALTFFAAAKKDKQRKRLKPPAYKRVPRAATVVVHLESVFPHTPRS